MKVVAVALLTPVLALAAAGPPSVSEPFHRPGPGGI